MIGAVAEGLLDGIANGWTPRTVAGEPPVVVYGLAPPPPSQQLDTQLMIAVGLQSVEDSDGAATVELRVSSRDFAIGVRGTTFYEKVATDDGQRWLELDLGLLSLGWRLLDDPEYDLWVEGGVAALNTIREISLAGAHLGLRGTIRLGGSVSLLGELRYARMQEDVSFKEARAQVAFSVLRVGYRATAFDVGPPLRGPEVGLAFEF